ncbi:MAG: YceI family protein [Flavobacteriales bacterium]|nr:YceI family protein [Flavobacteriales bacterium]
MKYIVFTILILSVGLFAFKGEKSVTQYSSASSLVTFYSWAPMEDIKAENTNTKSFIRTTDNSIVVRVPIKSFKFEKALMEEHFNENYLESDEFPNATFSGKIIGEYDLKKDGVYNVKAKGDFTLHGVKKSKEFEGTLEVKGEKVTLNTKFDVLLEDHDIEIPKVVFQNIAEKIEVKINITYVPYKK